MNVGPQSAASPNFWFNTQNRTMEKSFKQCWRLIHDKLLSWCGLTGEIYGPVISLKVFKSLSDENIWICTWFRGGLEKLLAVVHIRFLLRLKNPKHSTSSFCWKTRSRSSWLASNGEQKGRDDSNGLVLLSSLFPKGTWYAAGLLILSFCKCEMFPEKKVSLWCEILCKL